MTGAAALGFAVGDRVEATGGDLNGMRGFVIAVAPELRPPIQWMMDEDGTRVWCVPRLLRHVPEDATPWLRCGHEDCAENVELALLCWRREQTRR